MRSDPYARLGADTKEACIMKGCPQSKEYVYGILYFVLIGVQYLVRKVTVLMEGPLFQVGVYASKGGFPSFIGRHRDTFADITAFAQIKIHGYKEGTRLAQCCG